MQLVADLFDEYMPGFVRIMLKTYDFIWRLLLKLFDFHPWNHLWEYISFALTFLVLLAPIFIVMVFIWALRKRIMIRMGKDARTNYRRYQESFIDHYSGLPRGIAQSISMRPKGLSFHGDLFRGILKILVVICVATSLSFFVLRPAIYGLIDLIDTLYYQLSYHRYTTKFFLGFIFLDIIKICLPVIIPVAVPLLADGANMIYDNMSLLLKSKTRVTTTVRRVKKVNYDK